MANEQKNILVPTDFSEISNNALIQAIYLADKIEAKLVIYHVYHRPVTDADSSSALLKIKTAIDEKFKELYKKIPELKDVAHDCIKELGISVDNIIEMTKKESIDLILMATGGAESIDEIWGTKTAKIIKGAEVPVFVIPDHSSLKEIQKVCLACDYSLHADYHDIDLLVKLAEHLNLTIDVVTLNRNERQMTHQELENREMLIKNLKDVESSFSFTHSSNIEEGIIDYSKANNIGLISILPKSYSFIERLFHESLTEKMVFHSRIPLLVLK